ncbi:helix-turn-helix domain-containing protein [Aquiflexum sp. TKW24L]|uniref:helix-turn-helix domain-containing protein n=1 Tax=Aquiflexum sp. TKW24L TaxID=2942212 RepID=UPI0020BE1A47|nr:helix-turn-helix domain-containing protein [Aquiflexum sp. TKW24L]MCL6259422.1 helix-turn-helix domain-containing protein [Aquiflexum sp. TKW24L]
MILRDFLPSPSLREYVRKHQVIRFEFGAGEIVPTKMYSPRPETCLVFYLRDLQDIGYQGRNQLTAHPRCTINGQHTVVTKRYNGRDFWAVQIVLQPSALYLLTGIPAQELTNTFIDAEDVWGKEIRMVHEQMCNTDGVEEVIRIAELFLERLIRRPKYSLQGIDKVSAVILNQNRSLSMDKLAADSCLSNRQFQRRFTERTGIGPKLFDKVVRFEKAFFMKNANPHLDWLSIALACGYYDYQHLAKDYKYFTNLTPTGFYELDTKAPERTFGVVEVKQELLV